MLSMKCTSDDDYQQEEVDAVVWVHDDHPVDGVK